MEPTSGSDPGVLTRRIPQLDAVRGIAILLVIAHNIDWYSPRPLRAVSPYGWMGVDLFFALSGFLITGILWDSRQSQSYFKCFYVRRALRILPLYYSVLILMFLIVPQLLASAGHNILQRSSPWWAYPFFLQNFFVAIPPKAAGPLGVTWSLAIEEQFYLIWPWVIRYCSLSQIKRIAATVILASPLLRFYLARHRVDIYSNVFCRLDGLMAGALLALLVRSEHFVPGAKVKLAWIFFLIAACLAVFAEDHHARWFGFSMTSLASVSLVYLAIFSKGKWTQSILRNRFLGYTGVVSYGLYLLHKIPFDVIMVLRLGRNPLLAMFVTVAASYMLAIASWTFLEKPFLRLNQLFDFRSAAPRLAQDGSPRFTA